MKSWGQEKRNGRLNHRGGSWERGNGVGSGNKKGKESQQVKSVR